MLVSSTPAPKKRKRTSAPKSAHDVVKKKKKRNSTLQVPELILCANELKSEDVKDEKSVLEAVLDLQIKSENDVLDIVKHIKAEPVDTDQSLIKPLKLKKRKKKHKLCQDEVVLQTSGGLVGCQDETVMPISGGLSGFIVKDEPCSPEKLPVKVEPIEFSTLFNSNIKKELEDLDDAVDEHVCKKLSYKLSDSCIEQYTSTLHCTIPPLFINNIRNGIKSQLKTLHLKYLESERGVLLRYTHIKPQQQTASIVSISPELHFDVDCLVTVFKPTLGAQLEGVVVKIGPGYVNCLVFGYFTAVVYDRFSIPVKVGSTIQFVLKFYQVTVHNDFILKGSPVAVG